MQLIKDLTWVKVLSWVQVVYKLYIYSLPRSGEFNVESRTVLVWEGELALTFLQDEGSTPPHKKKKEESIAYSHRKLC